MKMKILGKPLGMVGQVEDLDLWNLNVWYDLDLLKMMSSFPKGISRTWGMYIVLFGFVKNIPDTHRKFNLTHFKWHLQMVSRPEIMEVGCRAHDSFGKNQVHILFLPCLFFSAFHVGNPILVGKTRGNLNQMFSKDESFSQLSEAGFASWAVFMFTR